MSDQEPKDGNKTHYKDIYGNWVKRPKVFVGVKLKRDQRFIKDAEGNWIPSPKSGQGELFLKGQILPMTRKDAKFLALDDEDTPIKPEDFQVSDKQVTQSHTKTAVDKTKVTGKKAK